MNERRANQPVRAQAQQWYDALRTHLAGAQNDLAERLRTWATLDDLLAQYPRLVPPLLMMAWQLRHDPGFAPHFQTASGEVAESPTTPLKPCGKSFDKVVLAHLQGAMRTYCARQEDLWLATEKTRHQPSWVVTAPVIGTFMRRALGQRDEDIVRHYPQHGLYLALKPWLRHPSQFALIEALATLPTAMVAILGDTTAGLSIESSIRNLAALETRKCKFIVGLARLYAETVIAEADAAQAGGATGPGAALAEIAGTALSQLTIDGLHLAKGAIAVREIAPDVVVKMTGPMGHGLWRVFASAEAATNIALCPAALARAIGEAATRVNRKTSEALNAIPDKRIIATVVTALSGAAGPDALAAWAASPLCATAWLRIGTEVKKILAQRGHGEEVPSSIAPFCQSLVPTFASLSAGPQQAPPALPLAGGPPPTAQTTPPIASSPAG